MKGAKTATRTSSKMKTRAATATLLRMKRRTASAPVLERLNVASCGTVAVVVVAMVSGLLDEGDARIDQRVSQVRQQIGHTDERGPGQRGGHDQRVIPINGGRHQKLADAGDAENTLDKEGPGNQPGGHGPPHGNERGQGVLKDVNEGDGGGGHALGPR